MTRTTRRGTPLGAFALALLSFGCAPRSNAGTQCLRSSDCATPLVCLAGQCAMQCASARDCAPYPSTPVCSASGACVAADAGAPTDAAPADATPADTSPTDAAPTDAGDPCAPSAAGAAIPVFLLTTGVQPDATTEYFRRLLQSAGVTPTVLSGAQLRASAPTRGVYLAAFTNDPTNDANYAANAGSQVLGQALNAGAWVLAEGLGRMLLDSSRLGAGSPSQVTLSTGGHATENHYFVAQDADNVGAEALFCGLPPIRPTESSDRALYQLTPTLAPSTFALPVVDFSPLSASAPRLALWQLDLNTNNSEVSSYCMMPSITCEPDRTVTSNRLYVLPSGPGRIVSLHGVPVTFDDAGHAVWTYGTALGTLYTNAIQWARRSIAALP